MPKWIYTKTVPDKIYVACSGGVDSVAAASILSNWKNITLCHFSHKDHISEQEKEVVFDLSKILNIPVIFEKSKSLEPKANRESIWRAERYEWFQSLDYPVVTAHTLDDAVEWYMMTCLRGGGEYMRYQNKNVIRPFLYTRKYQFEEHVKSQGLEICHDWTNDDPDFCLRNKIRKEIMPGILSCSPNLYSVVRNRIRIKEMNNE